MDRATVESALIESRRHTIATLGLKPKWWPTSSGKKQAQGAAWSTAFFLKVATDLLPSAPPKQILACSAGSKKPLTRLIVQSLWTGPERDHVSEQISVDFAIQDWSKPKPLLMTAESELFPSYSHALEILPTNGYAWDFMKLLLMPSPLRLFFARVAASPPLGVEDRCDAVAESLVKLFSKHRELLDGNDRVGCVVVPASRKAHLASNILWREGDSLCRCRISQFDLA